MLVTVYTEKQVFWGVEGHSLLILLGMNKDGLCHILLMVLDIALLALFRVCPLLTLTQKSKE